MYKVIEEGKVSSSVMGNEQSRKVKEAEKVKSKLSVIGIRCGS